MCPLYRDCPIFGWSIIRGFTVIYCFVFIADHEQAHIYEVGCPVALRGKAWYHAGISREMAEQQLENTPNGYFLVRDSETKSGCFSLSLKHPGGIVHFRIERKDSGLYEIPGTHESFATLLDLIDHFKHNPISEHPYYKIIFPCHRVALLGGELKWELDAWLALELGRY